MAATHQPRVSLLAIHPDLGADLSAEAFVEAARITVVPAVGLTRGAWTVEEVRGVARVRGDVFACLVVEGLVARDVALTDRVCTHIFGPRDLLSLDALVDGSLPVDVRYTALTDAQLVLLDDHFLAAAQRFPRMVGRLVDSATSQLGGQSANQAVSQLPRVEDRLLALFWQFADRWGTRGSGTIRIQVPLTHEALGTLIGARRPTVSLGLRALADADWLVREGDTWTLAVASIERLTGIPEPRRRSPKPKPTPTLPLPELGGELAERIAVLNIKVAAGLDRAARTVDATREIRDRINAARADRIVSPAAK
ncbi:MAG: family transcriptional regulator, cyclic receptor protein [Solirubrobacteraceae bacterium]|jgi:CRP-like cAMP-binding protein|nr:family transcriptional regulator, cyclic receptor protein [Solirubrobacteraceae bacterium]